MLGGSAVGFFALGEAYVVLDGDNRTGEARAERPE